MADRSAQVWHVDTELVEQRGGAQLHLCIGQPQPSELAPEKQVRRRAQVLAQPEVLPHDRRWVIAGHLDRPGVGRHVAGDAADERGFSGRVLADEGHELTGVDGEVHPFEDALAPEPFGQVAHAQQHATAT